VHEFSTVVTMVKELQARRVQPSITPTP
jgi:hypothetical protein